MRVYSMCFSSVTTEFLIVNYYDGAYQWINTVSGDEIHNNWQYYLRVKHGAHPAILPTGTPKEPRIVSILGRPAFVSVSLVPRWDFLGDYKLRKED